MTTSPVKKMGKDLLKFAGVSGFKLLSREGTSLEFKESFNWGEKDSYAKTVAAFANAKGGSLIFGVKNNPRELTGLRSNSFEDLDEAKIAEYLNSVLSPEIQFEKTVENLRGKTIGVLRIYKSERKPVVAIKNGKEIKEGEIYYRYNARTDKVKYAEMRSLLEEIQMQERNFWKQMFERIAQIGTDNIAVMDVAEGIIEGKGGTVVIDEKLLSKLKFIKEGSFKEGGTPTLRLVGDMTPVSVIASKKAGRRNKFQIVDNDAAVSELRGMVKLSEKGVPVKFSNENVQELNKLFPFTYAELLVECKKKKKVPQKELQKYIESCKQDNELAINWGLIARNLEIPATIPDRFTYSRKVIERF